MSFWITADEENTMTRREIISLIILIAVVSFGAYKYFTRAFSETKSQYLLDTVVEISATSQSKNIGRQIDSVFTFIKTLQIKLDEYNEDSWIALVNNSGDTKFPMDSDVYELLSIADSLYSLTDGAFDPTIKPVWDAWGFNSESPTVPDSLLIKEELKRVDFSKIKFNKQFLYKPAGMQITLGAVAKGYILDKAREYMISLGLNSGYINCRSSMSFFGSSIPQLIYIQHPRKADDYIASFKIMNESVGTSGDYQQFYEIDGIRYHHIINPKTGYPVENVNSVTILMPSAAWADGLSTALFLMPPDKALAIVEKFQDTEAIIYYTESGETVSLKSEGMKKLSLNEKL